jgi:hypothetical protein
MRRPRLLLGIGLIVASCLASPHAIPGLAGAESLPDRLSDSAFWILSASFSEADGYFRSDNLLSNEIGFPEVLRELKKTPPAGEAYLGVGPEQNFNYIAALRPRIAFIVDIRRGNLDLHLMYKALFELSADRVEFVSKLFSRARPAGLTAESTVSEIFEAFAAMPKSEELYAENLRTLTNHLVTTKRLNLTAGDLNGIEFVYGAFYGFGPEIRYFSSQGGGYGGFTQPSYAQLMTVTDVEQPVSYLATEQSFRVLKELESRNLLVPVVGNFGGSKAIRAIGQYLHDHGAKVGAFYLSNVEMYLGQQSLWDEFCRNASALPVDSTSLFIRSERTGGFNRGIGLNLTVAPIADDVKVCQ